MKKKSKRHNTSTMRVIAPITLAVVVLVGAGFITGVFQAIADSLNGWPELGIGPTPSDPLRIAPPTVTAGQITRMTLGFYNGEQADVVESVFPRMSCTGITTLEILTEGQVIPVGTVGEYASRVTVPEDTPDGYYPCVLTLSKTQKAFFLMVD